MSSATGGQLVFNYNTFLQRGLNLLDVADLPTARANLGISSANGLTVGSGLNPSGTTFNFTAPVALSVNSSTTGTASTIAQYDTSGSLTTSGYVNVGYGTVPTTSVLNFNAGTTGALASITRGSGTNGALTISNSGTGGLVLGATSLNGGLSADTINTSGVLNVAYGTTPVASTINFNCGTSSPLGYLVRSTGTNGGMLLTNSGTGGITVNGSLLSLVSSGLLSFISATNSTLTTASGTTVGLSAGATGTTSLTVNSTSGSGNQALAVSGGATMDNLTVSGTTTTPTLTVSTSATTPTLSVTGTASAATLTVSGTASTQTLSVGGTATVSTLSMPNLSQGLVVSTSGALTYGGGFSLVGATATAVSTIASTGYVGANLGFYLIPASYVVNGQSTPTGTALFNTCLTNQQTSPSPYNFGVSSTGNYLITLSNFTATTTSGSAVTLTFGTKGAITPYGTGTTLVTVASIPCTNFSTTFIVPLVAGTAYNLNVGTGTSSYSISASAGYILTAQRIS